MIVMKFGGSSLAGPRAVRRAAAIVAARAAQQPVVVVSAPGKSTDRLLAMAGAAAAGRADRAGRLFDSWRRYTQRLAQAVCPANRWQALQGALDAHFEELSAELARIAAAGALDGEASDRAAAFGERLSGAIVAEALIGRRLAGVCVDARKVIVTEERKGEALPLFDETRRRLRRHVRPLIAQGEIPVLGGFIAADRVGKTTTLGRGGSDHSASLIGAGLAACEIQIWTDVDGVMTADPSLIHEARSLKTMSFGEAAELAYFGGRVLHPATMLPAMKHDIPIRVLNSQRPRAEGTLIVKQSEAAASVVKSIAYKENITLIDIRSTRMLMAHGFLAEIFSVFEKYGAAVDMVSTSEVSVSLTVDKSRRLPQILRDLGRFAHVEAAAGQAIVCVVGDGIRYTPGIAAKVFAALEGVRIRMISLGASRLNIGFVIAEGDIEAAVKKLHAAFFNNGEAKRDE